MNKSLESRLLFPVGPMYGAELASKEDSRGAPVPMVSMTCAKRGDSNGAPAPARGH